MVKNNKAFTLVELLAVIVILAIILVIAVPQIISTITESRKGALSSSAKLIAGTAESMKISNQALGIEKDITCQDVSSYTEEDYMCNLEFVDGKAKVTLVGKGKFEGMYVCDATKEDAVVTEDECPTPFEKDSWATIKAAVTAGDTSKYNVGDTKTVNLGSLGTHTVRIANKSACPTGSSALASETACGFVIEFADIITEHAMNSTATTAGGWPASGMRTYLNSKDKDGNHVDGGLYDLLVAAIGDIIIDTTVVSGHGSGDTTGTLANNNFESTDKVYLLSTREIWGKEGTSNQINHDTADGDTITRQLDYYKNNNVSTSSPSGAKKQYSGSAKYWWLRSANSSVTYLFYTVSNYGSHYIEFFYYPDYSNGVSPAFRLG